MVRSSDGTAIGWAEVGEGPAVVLVHGLTECSAAWDPLIGRLSADHRVFTLDLRGHGRSERPANGDYSPAALAADVAAVLDASGVGPDVHLVGHSLGGLVVAMVGASRPVGSVVVVDQPLRLAGFREQVGWFEAELRDPASFPAVMTAVFAHLSLFGTDPGPDYAPWLALRFPAAVVEVWDGHRHYPHLVDPDRFTARLRAFWSGAAGTAYRSARGR